MTKYLDFEKQIADVEGELKELEILIDQSTNKKRLLEKMKPLQDRRDKVLMRVHEHLTPWQRVQLAKHPDRPQFLDYLSALFVDFVPLAGDRLFGEETAIIGGLARFQGRPVMVIGQHKGKALEERLHYKFGMPNPEGYRKAQRLMNLASYYHLPILSFIDTPGAGAGEEAEARGQGEAIAKGIQACLRAEVPVIAIVIGEGFSGGAIAVGTADRFLMLENSIFTVISPSACASILWKDTQHAETAAAAMKITAVDIKELGIADEIIAEPLGGAHRDAEVTFKNVAEVLNRHLSALQLMAPEKLVQTRRLKYLGSGFSCTV